MKDKPTLYLIPTPIAENALHTLPLYATDTVRDLDFFIAEKAKTARHFLKAVGMHKPLPEITVIEIDERDPEIALAGFRKALQDGKSVGLLSEAGCPAVADPGAVIVAQAHRAGIRVVPLVGPSSILLALMASGMNGQQFAFNGYQSPKRPELARDLRRLEQLALRLNQTQLFIETPYRTQMVLEVALDALQPGTVFGVALDVTGADEYIRSLPIATWRKQGLPELAKLPAIFMIGT
jgi:16S rRNA (cytidine1402-2'-O)-methyltransferase